VSWRGVGKGCVAREGWEERSFGEGGGVGYAVGRVKKRKRECSSGS